MVNLSRAIESGLALTLFLNACAPINSSEKPVVSSGAGTPVPEYTPGVEGGVLSLDQMFGLKEGSVHSVEPMCSVDRFFCIPRALDKDGVTIGGTSIFNPTINSENNSIVGWVPGGVTEGSPDGSVSVKSVIKAQEVDNLIEYFDRNGRNMNYAELMSFLDRAAESGLDVETSLSINGNDEFLFVAMAGNEQVQVSGVMTSLTAEEVIGSEASGQQMAFAGVKTDGGMLGIQFGVEKSEVEIKFNSLQERIAQGNEYTLMQDGTIQNSKGEQFKGLMFDHVSGKLLLGSGSTVECDPNSLNISDNGDVTVKTVEGVEFTRIGNVWEMTESDAGAIVTPEANGVQIDNVNRKVLDSLNESNVDLSKVDGVNDLGDTWQYTDAVNNKTITIAKSAVQIKGDWAIMGLWNLNVKTGEFVFSGGSAAPKSSGEIDGFRKFVVTEGSPSEVGQWETIHLAIKESFKKIGDYDPTSVFTSGVMVKDGEGERQVTLKDIDPENWYTVDNSPINVPVIDFRGKPKNHYDIYGTKNGKSWYEDNPTARPIQVSVDRGYFVVQMTSAEGTTNSMLAVPVLAYEGGESVSVGLALVDLKYADDEFMGLLNVKDRPKLHPVMVYGADLSKSQYAERVEKKLLSDLAMRKMMVKKYEEIGEPVKDVYTTMPQSFMDKGIFDLWLY